MEEIHLSSLFSPTETNGSDVNSSIDSGGVIIENVTEMFARAINLIDPAECCKTVIETAYFWE